jgi:hypothetical protein
MTAEGWEREAENWIAWTRTPGHDAYHLYRDAFFELLPAPGAATLEVGCGEGRVARDLTVLGHRVAAVDAAPSLIRAAQLAHPEGTYLAGDGAGSDVSQPALLPRAVRLCALGPWVCDRSDARAARANLCRRARSEQATVATAAELLDASSCQDDIDLTSKIDR